MKKALKVILKILKWICLVIVTLVVILLIVRLIGQKINSKTPENGINEEMYIDVNGQQQWISIYGENKDNPAMLYLHGGPGNSTSYADWAIVRKLSKDYTVISWDQRNSGKTWIKDPKSEPITPEMMRSDLEVVVDYTLQYLGKDTVTLLGMSWGTYYGCDYALNHPDKVDCIINLSQCVDNRDGMLAVKDELLKRSEGDAEDHELAEQYDPLLLYDLSEEDSKAFDDLMNALPEERPAMLQSNPKLQEIMEKLRNQSEIMNRLYDKYMPDDESVFDSDINIIAAVYFCPYYSLSDLYKISRYGESNNFELDNQKAFYTTFSLKDRTSYEMPFYVLQGDDDDYGDIVKNYMDNVTAPDKDLQYIEGGHMSTMLQTEKMTEFVHGISEKQKELK